MDSLKIIQKLSKIGKILSKIIYYFSIVVACSFSAMIPTMVYVSNKGGTYNGLTFAEYIKNLSGYDIKIVYCVLAFALIGSIFNAILSKMATNYFENELESKTPFTYNGADELFKLGIFQIAFELIIFLLFTILSKKYSDDTITYAYNISLGITFIIFSFVFRYGAKVLEENKKLNEIKDSVKKVEEVKDEIKKVVLKQLPKKEEIEKATKEVKKTIKKTAKKVEKKADEVKKSTTKKAPVKKTTTKKTVKKETTK